VHIAIDDATRLAYVEVLADEKAVTAVAFLRRAIAHFNAFGIRVERLMTDNGSAYRATIHALACRALGIKHLRTRPYLPRTNGKAERFIRTMLGGWAYGAIYRDSDERRRALGGWIDFYNRRRPHRSLGRQAPLERLRALNGKQRPRVLHLGPPSLFQLIHKLSTFGSMPLRPWRNDSWRLAYDVGLSRELLDFADDLALDQVQEVAELGGVRVKTASVEEQLARSFGTSDVGEERMGRIFALRRDQRLALRHKQNGADRRSSGHRTTPVLDGSPAPGQALLWTIR
jgi:hypothetical protein